MCELLGMSANVPTDICFSFSGLLQRGGATGPHKDGWGVVFYEGKGVREFHDPEACSESPVAQLVSQYPIKSCCVISHIRQANVGQINLENTHPFTRELNGINWTFAHNGQIPDVLNLALGRYKPIGTTDSEHAFCWLMAKIEQAQQAGLSQPALAQVIYHAACELQQLGVYNMLLSNGTQLYAFCTTKLQWLTRKAPFGQASLKDTQLQVDFRQETTPNDVVTVIATEPLTEGEPWQAINSGEMLVFELGIRIQAFGL